MKTKYLSKFSTAKNSAVRKFYKGKAYIIKKSPELFLIAGTVSIVAGTVLACKATLALPDIMEQAEKDKKYIDTGIDAGVVTPEEAAAKKKDIKISTMLQIGKKYAPAVVMMGVGFGCIFEGHHIMSVRNLALATSLEATDTAFREYRRRIVDKFGEETDKDIFYGRETVEKEVTLPDGTTETVEEKEQVMDPIMLHTYLFDPASRQWNTNPRYNANFIQSTLETLQYELDRRGYLYLHEVLQRLEIPQDLASHTDGWIAGSDLSGVVDYKFIKNAITGEAMSRQMYINEKEPNVWIHFNCEPNIADKLFRNKHTHFAF